jgi:hypothetical protein
MNRRRRNILEEIGVKKYLKRGRDRMGMTATERCH